MEKVKRYLSAFLSLVLVLCLLPVTGVQAAETFWAAPAPFALSNAEVRSGNLTVNGTSYEGSVQFTMGYTGLTNGETAEATYNLQGKCEEMTFVSTFVKGADRAALLEVLKDDGSVIYSAPALKGTENHRFSVKGVSKLTVRFTSDGYDKTTHAITDVKVSAPTALSQGLARTNDKDYDAHRYLLQNAKVLTETFEMGSFRYENGYRFTMGYTGKENGYTSKIAFNLHESYDEFSFDLAKFMNRADESYTRSAYLTIEADGKTLEDYNGRELSWNDIALPVKLDVTGVTQLVITMVSEGYDKVHWQMGNIHLTDAAEPPAQEPAPEGMAPPAPFALSHAAVQKDTAYITDVPYSDAIVFTMGYTGTGNGTTGEITYNLEGLYKTLSFDAGFYSGDLRNASLTVLEDDKVVYEADVSYENVGSRHQVDVNGASKVTVRFFSDGYDKTKYAIGQIKAVPLGTVPAQTVAKSGPAVAEVVTNKQNTKDINGQFTMGGCLYEDGYLMTMGYNGYANGNTAKLELTLQGAYEAISFDIAKYMNRVDESYTRSALLTVEVDGQILPLYSQKELFWNDIPLQVNVDLQGAEKLVITVYSAGYDKVQWALGNIRLEGEGVTPEAVPATAMYRLYNPNSGEHFYTGSVEERDVLSAAGWQYEGVAWNAPTESGENVYRLYNPNSGDHHYTMSVVERDMLVLLGWQYEGVCWNSAPNDQIPQYRLYNPNADCGSHHYTGSEEERDYLVSLGWIYEGIGWYGMP